VVELCFSPTLPDESAARTNCINIRLPTYGGLFPWDREQDGREVRVRVEGQLIFNSVGTPPCLRIARVGTGLHAWRPGAAAHSYRSVDSCSGRLAHLLFS